MKGGIRAPRTPGGTWGYRIDLGPGQGGGRKQTQVAGFRSREEAETALAEALAARGGGDRKTVAGFLELVWLPAKQEEVDRSTFDQYAWAVRRHIVPALGECKLPELEPGQLDRWLRRLGSAARGDGGRPLSATSVRLVRKVLSMACEEAAQRGLLGDNPVRRTQLPHGVQSHQVGWTAEEARRFLAAADGHRLSPAFHLAVVAGLRRGELLGLRWSDLDLDAGRLRVGQQLMVEGGRARLKPVPERDRRTVGFRRRWCGCSSSTGAAKRPNSPGRGERTRILYSVRRGANGSPPSGSPGSWNTSSRRAGCRGSRRMGCGAPVLCSGTIRSAAQTFLIRRAECAERRGPEGPLRFCRRQPARSRFLDPL